MQLIGEMIVYFKNHQCRFLAAPTDVCLVRKNAQDKEIKTVLQPDLLVVCDLSKIKNNRNVVGAPDLVVEILSPGNSKTEMKQKYEVYEESGVLEYWIVFPETKSVQIFILNEHGKYIGLQPLTEDDILKSTTFAGLEVDLSAVFKNV
jgi:Uma2 family endonuclease